MSGKTIVKRDMRKTLPKAVKDSSKCLIFPSQ
jgi:hypothetical protein